MSKNNTVFIGKNKSFWERNRRSGGYLLKKRAGQIAISVIRGLLLFGLCFMIIQPLLTRFSMGLMQEQDLYDSTIILLPRHVTLDNYRIVAELTDLKTIGGGWHFNALLNTLWVSVLSSVFQIVATTLVAYGFARYEFPGKKIWFALVIALIIIPPQTIQSALYMNFANFDILRIFTLFGVNAEGLTFGQRVMSLFDGTGTGLISLITEDKR
uniref:Sugar ABC transporter permease n=1 Tax=uncultured bacterium Contig28b TaxID=1393549 RepID=W0FI98_9BACT|nr:sugar ABC transporter permease [uncultured bacterium Contig28b]